MPTDYDPGSYIVMTKEDLEAEIRHAEAQQAHRALKAPRPSFNPPGGVTEVRRALGLQGKGESPAEAELRERLLNGSPRILPWAPGRKM